MKIKLLYFLFFSVFLPSISKSENFEQSLIYDQDFYQNKWTQISGHERDSIKSLLQILKRSKTGRELVDMATLKAKNSGVSLLGILSAGEGSLTDTALIRRFTPNEPEKMEIEFKSQVFINKELPIIEAVLDLAHELTHFAMRRPFNPYLDGFSLESFIRNTVEGKGGEVAAYLTECQVLYELFPSHIRKKFHCHFIVDPHTGDFSRDLGIKQFYKVGNYYKDFKSSLVFQGIDHQFPLLSQDDAIFISSAYGLPYPVAAMQEFKSVVEKACLNDRRRLKIMKENLLMLHSSNPTYLQQRPMMENLEKSYFHRCENNT